MIKVKVLKSKDNPNLRCLVCVDNNLVMAIGEKRNFDDYVEEVLHGGNECAELEKMYVNAKTGRTIYVWYDWEMGDTYITFR